MADEETKKQRKARIASTLKKKPTTVSRHYGRGKQAPGRKKTKSKLTPSKTMILRRQAMNRIRKAMERGNVGEAQAEFFAWIKEHLLVPNDNWTDVIECELDWCRAEIGRFFPQ